MLSLAPAAGEDKGQGFLLLSSLLWNGMGLSRPILQGHVVGSFHPEMCLG